MQSTITSWRVRLVIVKPSSRSQPAQVSLSDCLIDACLFTRFSSNSFNDVMTKLMFFSRQVQISTLNACSNVNAIL